MSAPFRLGAFAAACLLLAGCGGARLNQQQQALLQAAQQAGAAAVEATPADDGGLRLSGELEGRRFAVAIPWRWRHESLLIATGYAIPGTPMRLPADLVRDDGLGMVRVPYAEGFAVGRSVYDKRGIGVETGEVNLYRLKQFLDRLGSTRAYVIGASMGGSITMALIEKHPADFAGAIAACGVVGDWETVIGHTIDVRAAYDYFTQGTPYAFPGGHDIAVSGLSTLSTAPLKWTWPLNHLLQMKRLAAPMLKLFAAAQASPQGAERRMVDNIAAASGAEADPASFLLPAATVVLGMDDLNQTLGGPVYDNTAKVYSSPLLSAQENAALNAGIRRIHAEPKAVAYVDQWYKSTGVFKARLISLYNAIDPEVPSAAQETLLREAVAHAGNQANLVQREVPSVRQPLFPGTDAQGYAHCGFTPDQVAGAWDDLRAWVESGKKPD